MTNNSHLKYSKDLWILAANDTICRKPYVESLKNCYNLKFHDNFNIFNSATFNIDLSKPLLFIIDSEVINKKIGLDNIPTLPFLILLSTDNCEAIRYCTNLTNLTCLMKPFSNHELLAKVNSIINFNKAIGNYGTPPFTTQTINGVEIKDLTPKEKKILSTFMTAADQTLTRKQMQQKIWGDVIIHSKTLNIHLYNLKKKIRKHDLTISICKRGWLLHPITS